MNTVNKLLKILGNDTLLKPYTSIENYIYSSGMKKWVANILPSELLKLNLKTSVEILTMLTQDGNFYSRCPDIINSPDYSDNWGVRANYIEINNRAIAEMHGSQCKNGLISTMKLLPAIPPSAKSWANCIILSQIFPNIYGDGYNKPANEENSIYGIKLNNGYSQNIINYEIAEQISAEEQFIAFNNLANFHGLKSGFRTVISADQIKISKN